MAGVCVLFVNADAINQFCTWLAYRVSGIDSKTTTRDIHNAMKMAAGRAGPEILTYEIVWVDDFTFLVGTRPLDDGVQISSHMTSEERMGVMKKHGRIIEETLRRRFPGQTIVSLKQHLGKTTKLVSAVLSEAAENDEEDVKTRHNIFIRHRHRWRIPKTPQTNKLTPTTIYNPPSAC